MGRWDPDAEGRLKQAALALYLERGYADVTVAEIAAAAGLTRRTFFRYFPDKREILFAGAHTFQDAVVTAVTDAPHDRAPVDVLVTALAAGSAQLAVYRPFARGRRDLIASSLDLQERELAKMASLTTAVTTALYRRGATKLRARLVAHAGVAAFTTAYDRWLDDEQTADLPALIHQSLDELRDALHPRRAAAPRRRTATAIAPVVVHEVRSG